jgi:hypothetical protein
MSDDPVRPDPAPTHASRRRYRRRAVELADGGRLVLGPDGTITHVAADGATTGSWAPDDPQWPDQALRFGLRPQIPTVTPTGRVQPNRPPRG